MQKTSLEIINKGIEKVRQARVLELKAKEVIHIPEGTATIYTMGNNSEVIRCDIKFDNIKATYITK